MAIDVRWGSASHQGRVRNHNEDALLAGPDVFAVADGMGGHAGGEVASALAVSRLAALDGLLGTADPEAAVTGALADANEAILRRARADGRLAGMGTTVAGIARTSWRAVVLFHLGDTRVYRQRKGELRQLTEDHSVVGELLRAGTITEDEARRHPHRSVVTRALGVGPVIEPVVTTLEVAVGDCFLIASDGLFNEVPADRIAEVLASPGTVEQRARTLLDAALAAGGRDNVSVIVVATAGTSGGDGLDVDTSPSRPAVRHTAPAAHAAAPSTLRPA